MFGSTLCSSRIGSPDDRDRKLQESSHDLKVSVFRAKPNRGTLRMREKNGPASVEVRVGGSVPLTYR